MNNVAVRPFLVESVDARHGNIFRVMRLDESISREQITKLLEKLPLGLALSTGFTAVSEYLNEPLEVEVSGKIISIYPPRNRVLKTINLDSWASHSVVRQMKVDNMPDMVSPGNGQIRSCIHFRPSVLGIKDWLGSDDEIEVDIHIFPKTKSSEPNQEQLDLDKFQVRDLIELIAGGEKELTPEQLSKWRELIIYAVTSMRNSYENPDVDEDYPVRVYYKPCWLAIDDALGDDKKMIEALEQLRNSIQWE